MTWVITASRSVGRILTVSGGWRGNARGRRSYCDILMTKPADAVVVRAGRSGGWIADPAFDMLIQAGPASISSFSVSGAC